MQNERPKILELRNVTKTYNGGKTIAVSDVSLSVYEGELIILLGLSGCGKTTTLKMINRLVDPTRGTVHFEGEDALSLDAVNLRRRIGYVFQNFGLFPHKTVAQNIEVVPRLLRWPEEDIERRVDELLKKVHLPPNQYRARYPRELSGGQRQRVAFARALAARPRVMLLDEPFGALDPITRDRLQTEFKLLHRDIGFTAVMVTHDVTEALLLADKIGVMREGQVLQYGPPHELMNNPCDDYVAELMDTPKRQANQVRELVGK